MGNLCNRFFSRQSCSDYQMLITSDHSDVEELNDFIDSTYTEFGIYKTDILAYKKDSDVIETLLKLLPLYKTTKLRLQILERFIPTSPSHVKDTLHIEYMKAKKILETLDIVFIKQIIGEFSTCAEPLDQLLSKFTADQSTLCDMEKIMNLIELDEQNSKRLLSETDPINDISDLSQLPAVPTHSLDINDKFGNISALEN